jgi:hypothetical protein
MNKSYSDIAVYLGGEGIFKITISSDDAETQNRAHELLAAVGAELRGLHLALRVANIRQDLLDAQSRATCAALIPPPKETE